MPGMQVATHTDNSNSDAATAAAVAAVAAMSEEIPGNSCNGNAMHSHNTAKTQLTAIKAPTDFEQDMPMHGQVRMEPMHGQVSMEQGLHMHGQVSMPNSKSKRENGQSCSQATLQPNMLQMHGQVSMEPMPGQVSMEPMHGQVSMEQGLPMHDQVSMPSSKSKRESSQSCSQATLQPSTLELHGQVSMESMRAQVGMEPMHGQLNMQQMHGQISKRVTAGSSGMQYAPSAGAVQPAESVKVRGGTQPTAGSSGSSGSRNSRRLLRNVCFTLVLPFMMVYWVLAHVAAWLITLTVLPSYLLAQNLYWACPFIPDIWKNLGPVLGPYVRIGFEASYCINYYTRVLTLPLRRQLPAFYIVGFPKCGTTSLAEHLRQHPAISGMAGLPYHEVLSKETHFFAGVLGRNRPQTAQLYRSFFPTLMHKWWAEVVRGVDKWVCFDACPVHACLPYVAERIAGITPNAKIVLMLRNPVNGVFSAEVMFREMGVPLPWTSLAEEMREGPGGMDPRFQVPADVAETWQKLWSLKRDEAPPLNMPRDFYFNLYSHMQCGKYNELLQPYLQHFPPENIMVINFNEFVQDSEKVVREVIEFVGLDAARLEYKAIPAGMKGNYQGKRMHPSVTAHLTAYYQESVSQLQSMLGRDMGWEGFEATATATAAATAVATAATATAVATARAMVSDVGDAALGGAEGLKKQEKEAGVKLQEQQQQQQERSPAATAAAEAAEAAGGGLGAAMPLQEGDKKVQDAARKLSDKEGCELAAGNEEAEKKLAQHKDQIQMSYVLPHKAMQSVLDSRGTKFARTTPMAVRRDTAMSGSSIAAASDDLKLTVLPTVGSTNYNSTTVGTVLSGPVGSWGSSAAAETVAERVAEKDRAAAGAVTGCTACGTAVPAGRVAVGSTDVEQGGWPHPQLPRLNV